MAVSRSSFGSSGDSRLDVLGLPLSSTPQEIKDRYLFLAKQLHPDVASANSSKSPQELAREFSRVKEAYESLRDEELRRKHIR